MNIYKIQSGRKNYLSYCNFMIFYSSIQFKVNKIFKKRGNIKMLCKNHPSYFVLFLIHDFSYNFCMNAGINSV